MFAKIEPTGCCVRNGMCQVRLSFFLEPDDYGYEKHFIDMPVFPEKGYSGEANEQGIPLDMEDYTNWIKSLPTTKQNNPFHNHFIYVEPDTPNDEIIDMAESLLSEAYMLWDSGKTCSSMQDRGKNFGKTREWNDMEIAEVLNYFIDYGLNNVDTTIADKLVEAQIRLDACEAKVNEVIKITQEIRIS